MSSSPQVPSQPQSQPKRAGWISLLEHIGEVGVESLTPFADGIGDLVNAVAPGSGPAVSALIKAVGDAEAQSHQLGRESAGSAKLSTVLGEVSPEVSQVLAAHGKPSGTDAVTALVNQTVVTLKALQVPTKVSAVDDKVTAKPVPADHPASSQVSQQSPQHVAVPAVKPPGTK
jgi:hypothetical protein